MTNREKIQKALENGATTFDEIKRMTKISRGVIYHEVYWMSVAGLPLYHLQREPAEGEVKNSFMACMEAREEFKRRNGFYPSHSWVSRKMDLSRERVAQLIGRRKTEKKDEGFCEGSVTGVDLEESVFNEVQAIADDEGLSFREALKAWSWRMRNA